MKILVAGFGNLLQRDDGFGVKLLSRLQQRPNEFADTIRFVEVGIGGITLIQELLDQYDALIVLDAIEGESPGEVKILEISLAARHHEPAAPTDNDFHHQDRFADIHYSEPGRAIALAHEVGRLPTQVYLIGCVPESTELGREMSPIVENAIEPAVLKFQQLIAKLRKAIPVESPAGIDGPSQDVKLNAPGKARFHKTMPAGPSEREPT